MRLECSKSELTKEEYYQLIGLLHLANQYYDKLGDIEGTLAATVGLPHNDIGDYGHVSDAIWSGIDGSFAADELMRKLKITVKEK